MKFNVELNFPYNLLIGVLKEISKKFDGQITKIPRTGKIQNLAVKFVLKIPINRLCANFSSTFDVDPEFKIIIEKY